MNEMVRNHQWPLQGGMKDPVKQIFDRLFEGSLFQNTTDESSVVTSQWVPRVDIKEEAARFVIYADVPGIDPQQIRVQADKGVLSIRGERRSEGSADSERFSRVERRHGSFHRRFTLPETADPEGVTAVGRNGVLEITIPKRSGYAARRTQVDASTVR